MSRRSLTVCGIARDCAAAVGALIPEIERLGALFGSYDVIAVENDSRDDTGAVLASWASRNPRVRVIRYCAVNFPGSAPKAEAGAGWFSSGRIERICFARNRYLEALDQASGDYVVVVDLDIRGLDVDGFVSSFAREADWDAVASNGQRFTPRHPTRRSVYWDTYAYEPESGFEDETQTLAQIRKHQTELARALAESEWVQARSAYGGMCIYRRDVLEGVRYAVVENADAEVPVLCEHVALHRAIRLAHPELRLWINSRQRLKYEPVARTLFQRGLDRLRDRRHP